MERHARRTHGQSAVTTRAGATIGAWWRGLPKEQRRSLIAIVVGLVATLMLVGLLPAARATWLAAVGRLMVALLDWAAPLALLGIVSWCVAVVVESARRRQMLRPGWAWCAGVALVLLATESRLIFDAPTGGLAGTLGADLLRLLPAPAAQLALLGGLALDLLIGFRISWREVQGVANWVARGPASPTPIVPLLTSAPTDQMAHGATARLTLAMQAAALPSRPVATAVTLPPLPPPPLPPQLVETLPFAQSGVEAAAEQLYDDLRIPAYLRRGALATISTLPNQAAPVAVAAGTQAETRDFALPPLPARQREIVRRAASSSPGSGDVPAPPPVRGLRGEASAPLWPLPPLTLLNKPAESRTGHAVEHAERLAGIIERTLKSFGVEAEVRRADISVGPTVIRFGVRPLERVRMGDQGRAAVDAQGEPIVTRTRVSRIMNLKDDLALVLESKTIRMEAPVPERPYVGIEIPNVYGRMVTVREILESHEFREAASRSKLAVALGRDVAGRVRVGDLARFPHALIAGATGAGKSVCLNAIITSLITHATPAEVRLVLIDPKMVEMTMYEGIPHLLAPVITAPDRVIGALESAIAEMERRYRLFARLGARNLEGYDALRAAGGAADLETLPRIVLIIDELADLMMVAADDVERHICRLAQLARATGIHLVVATQRPSVDVITGLFKANIPTRIAFMVSSSVDSRTILDSGGAEKLLGKGDMLFLASDAAKADRVQGAFVADDEVERLARFWRTQAGMAATPPAHWDLAGERHAS